MKPDLNNCSLSEKIEYGLKLSIYRLYEKMAANNEMAVVCENGVVKHISAKEAWEEMKNDPYFQ